FAKGGEFSPYFGDVHLVVNWAAKGAEIVNFVNLATGRQYSRPQNVVYYFRPGLTWTLRTQRGLNYRPMPAGCIFGHRGPAVFDEADSPETLLALLALVNSRAFALLAAIQTSFGSERKSTRLNSSHV